MNQVNLLFVFITLLIQLVNIDFANASIWVTDDKQAELDEINDNQILFAVQNSMRMWRLKKQLNYGHKVRFKRSEPKKVCYKNLDCFEDSGPFRYLEMLPNSPDEIGTRFILYASMTEARRARTLLPLHFNIAYDNIDDAWNWAKNHFNNSQPTKVIVHGFGSSCLNVWVYEMRITLANIENSNIVCIEWANGAQIPNYVRAAANTRLVGTQLGQLLRGLNEHANISYDSIHLIGFSLGAHVAGFAGSYLNGSLYRITGLDPAGPLFETRDSKVRLDSTDAKFVDVIHSNGENLVLGGLGAWEPMGDVDFYPNGGRVQKGCANLFVGAVSDIIWSASSREGRSLCNHRRAYKFFTESVLPNCQFPAFSCTSYNDFLMGKCFPCTDEKPCANMGYYADKSLARGQFYLITRETEPFCAHQYRLTIKSSPGKNNAVTFGKIDVTISTESEDKESFTLTQRDDEELKSHQILSKIFVPHPIIVNPTKIEILYTNYKGWISSGLPKWLIDKVSIENSYGKSLSFCKKSIKLESSVSITIPLFVGNCHYENETFLVNDDLRDTDREIANANLTELFDKNTNSIIEELLNLPEPWNSVTNNDIPMYDTVDPFEQSRALNIRKKHEHIQLKALDQQQQNFTNNKIMNEIVEPVLIPKFDKKRSHRSDTIDRKEITEPILPITAGGNKSETISFRNSKPDSSELNEEFYTDVLLKDEFNLTKTNSLLRKNDLLAITVQILPEKLTKVFEKVENYTREVILPLISANTPKFINDLFWPFQFKNKTSTSFSSSAASVASESTSASQSASVSSSSSSYEIKYLPTMKRIQRTFKQLDRIPSNHTFGNLTLINKNDSKSSEKNVGELEPRNFSIRRSYSVDNIIKYIPLKRVQQNQNKSTDNNATFS